jgi:integrase
MGPDRPKGRLAARRKAQARLAFDHPLRGPELRALRAWKREQGYATPYVFTSLSGGPMTRRTVHHVVAQAAKACAGIEFPVHPDADGCFVPDAAEHMAAACYGLLSRERRLGYARDSTLPRPQEHAAHGELRGQGAGRFKDF